MAEYIVNKNAQEGSGEHEVHDLSFGCPHLPNPENQYSLGNHSDCSVPVAKANMIYPPSNGCFYCCKKCHTG